MYQLFCCSVRNTGTIVSTLPPPNPVQPSCIYNDDDDDFVFLCRTFYVDVIKRVLQLLETIRE